MRNASRKARASGEKRIAARDIRKVTMVSHLIGEKQMEAFNMLIIVRPLYASLKDEAVVRLRRSFRVLNSNEAHNIERFAKRQGREKVDDRSCVAVGDKENFGESMSKGFIRTTYK